MPCHSLHATRVAAAATHRATAAHLGAATTSAAPLQLGIRLHLRSDFFQRDDHDRHGPALHRNLLSPVHPTTTGVRLAGTRLAGARLATSSTQCRRSGRLERHEPSAHARVATAGRMVATGARMASPTACTSAKARQPNFASNRRSEQSSNYCTSSSIPCEVSNSRPIRGTYSNILKERFRRFLLVVLHFVCCVG